MIKKIICILFIISTISLFTVDINGNEKTKFKSVSKDQIKELLDEEHIMWKKDSDGDGLPDALEIILNTNIHKKDSDNDGLDDKLEIELDLNPNKKDSDDNGIDDKDEDFDNDGISNKNEIKKSRNPSMNDGFITKALQRGECIDITGKVLLESCNLAWETIDNEIVGKSVKELFPDKYELLHGFTVIRHTQTKGFSAIAIKNCDSVIVAYQASKTYRDWIGNFLTQFMPHPQRNAAIDFIKPIVNKNEKIYITGHSLGGLLAQYSTYYLKNEGYTNLKTVTFNSANNMNPKHIEGKYGPPIIKPSLIGDYILTYEHLLSKITKGDESENNSLVDFFNKSINEDGFIDLYNSKWENSEFTNSYDDIIENYIINEDPLYLIINGEYLGKKNIKSSNYNIQSMPEDSNELSNAHKLQNFYNEDDLNKVITIN